MALIDRDSHMAKFWIILIVALLAWFLYGYEQLKPFIIENSISAFFILMLVFCFMSMKYIMRIEPLAEPKVYLSFFLMWLAFDLVTPPYVINSAGPVTTDPTVFTSDVVAWSIISSTFHTSADITYLIVLILTPLALLIVSWNLLANQAHFFEGVKNAL